MSLGKKMQYARGDLKYIPQYETWLYKHSRDLITHHEIMATIIHRPKRIRTNSFSASGAGRCLRERQLFYYVDKSMVDSSKPDEKTMNIFVNGDFVHLRHQIAGLQMGYFTGAEVATKNDEWWLTGTMDAVDDDGGVGEIKSINSNGFRGVASFGVKYEHNEQLHSYMLCSDRDHGRVLYENKDTNEMKEFLVKREQRTIDKIKRDLETLIHHIETNTIIQHEQAGCNNRRCVACQISDEDFASLRDTRPQQRSIRVKRSSPRS